MRSRRHRRRRSDDVRRHGQMILLDGIWCLSTCPELRQNVSAMVESRPLQINPSSRGDVVAWALGSWASRPRASYPCATRQPWIAVLERESRSEHTRPVARRASSTRVSTRAGIRSRRASASRARASSTSSATSVASAPERGGKLIIATRPGGLPRLDELERRGRHNGVPGLGRMGHDRSLTWSRTCAGSRPSTRRPRGGRLPRGCGARLR